MVARVTSVPVRPEDVAESVQLFDESVIPAAEQEEGFMGVLLLTREESARHRPLRHDREPARERAQRLLPDAGREVRR
jgi:hypothetical protein